MSGYEYVRGPIADGQVAATVELRPGLNVDLDGAGRVLGVEHVGGPVTVRELVEVIRALRHPASDPIVAHAAQLADCSMQVRRDDPAVEDVFPLDRWMDARRRFGGKVYRRTVIVVADWEEVPK